MTYFVKHRNGTELFKSETATNAKEALQEAVKGGADLGGAYLGGQWIIQGQTRSDGYAFFLQRLTDDTEPMIKAGCRHFTTTQAREHWQTTRGGTPLGDETFAIIDCLVRTMEIRGLK